MPEAMREEGRKTFLMVPFVTEPRREIARKTKMYAEFKAWQAEGNRGPRMLGGYGTVFEKLGVGRRTGFGATLDLEKLPPVPVPSREGMFLHHIFKLYPLTKAEEARKAYLEGIGLVRQLKQLGYGVAIHDLGDKRQDRFLRAAVKAGATRLRAGDREVADEVETKRVFGKIYSTLEWAREHHVKIEGVLERPEKSPKLLLRGSEHLFGEGGSMVQVGPKDWLVTENILEDPRVKKYEAKGHRFYAMPDGIFHDRTLSDLLGEPIYTNVPHIDYNLGGIPEKKIVAVDPNYLSQHKLSVEMMRDNLGVKIVEVPKEEAGRHPANFLPLGNGRVLVDSGAPKFIARLREAGVDVVPTAVPLNAMLLLKGGLHCLFNEL